MSEHSLAEKYKFYELEDEVNELKRENKSLSIDNSKLKDKIMYYESTKAHKIWKISNKSHKKNKIKKIRNNKKRKIIIMIKKKIIIKIKYKNIILYK